MEKRNSIISASVYKFFIPPRKDGQDRSDKKSIKDMLPTSEMKRGWSEFEGALIKYSNDLSKLLPEDSKEFYSNCTRSRAPFMLKKEHYAIPHIRQPNISNK